MNKKLSVLMAVFLTFVVAFTSTFSTRAQTEGPQQVCGQGICTDTGGDGTTQGGAVPDKMNPEGLGRSNYYYVHGGYVAAGVGLRNLGTGTITLTGIPAGAKVISAYLYWNIVNFTQNKHDAQLTFKGKTIKGTFLGLDHQPCWLPEYASSYSYRADVTKLVKGNGKFKVSGVASGVTSGTDPWTHPIVVVPPLAEGASLVAIYTKSDLPKTEIFIWDGATSAAYGLSPYITVGPFVADKITSIVQTTTIAADGQSDAVGPTISVNAYGTPGSGLDGGDPKLGGGSYLYGNLWDTKNFYVGTAVTPGDTLATITLNASGLSADCVTWVAQVFSINGGDN